MSRRTPARYCAEDPWLAFGSVFIPTFLLAYCVLEKGRAEQGEIAAISMAQAFPAIMLAAAAVVVAFFLGILFSGWIPLRGFFRFFVGFALGLFVAGAATAVFLLL